MQQRTSLLPLICLVLAMVLWASSFIALKLAFEAYDPMVVIFGRMAVAGMCFLFFAGRFRGIAWRRSDLKLVAFMVFCEPCLYFLFETHAVRNTTASQAGMITAVLPLMVAVAASVFLHERVSKRTLAGFVIAIAGVILLSASSVPSESAPHPALGNFLEVLAMVCAIGYTITLKKLTARYSPLVLTALQAFVGSVFFFPFLLLPGTSLPTEFLLVPALSIVYLGIFVSIGAYGLYNFSVSRMPASQASAFVNLIPAFTVFLGWLILGERFTPLQYVASIIVFTGVFLSQDRPDKTVKQEI
ncbi:MAG TPA: DMT family transporter [Deltaproteobacteria bacterium]|nr:DMT family transporter [Deltaproteobacteria bacterium]HQI01289.1 DMT family transporter [Deltaproteobacteria bacterium]